MFAAKPAPIVITPDDLTGMKFCKEYSSPASDQLELTFTNGFSCKFYGSADDKFFLPHFTLKSDDGTAFVFKPSSSADALEQFRRAINEEFVNLEILS